jgi:hypothetical protein
MILYKQGAIIQSTNPCCSCNRIRPRDRNDMIMLSYILTGFRDEQKPIIATWEAEIRRIKIQG